MKQYEDELARKRMMADHELQRQRNAEMAKLQVGAGGGGGGQGREGGEGGREGGGWAERVSVWWGA